MIKYTYLGKCGSNALVKIYIDVQLGEGIGQDLDVEKMFRIEFSICE